MSKEIEIEFKNMLLKEEYEMLLNEYHLTDSSLKTQTNIYFDTPDFKLKSKKMGLRVRLSNKKIEFTLKTPTSNQHTLLEITDYLDSFDSQLPLSEQIDLETSDVKVYLARHGIELSTLQSIGELSTTRGEVLIKSNVLLVLDKSLYYGKTDYEIEMEVSDADEGFLIFKDTLKKYDIPTRKADKKIARMLAYKENISV